METKFERDPGQSIGWLIFFGIVALEVWACQTGRITIGILLAVAGLFIGALLMSDFRLIIRFIGVGILKEGFEFGYHGDSIIYLWPWRRHRLFPPTWGEERKWYSHSFLACYRTLKELDQEWDDYIKACNSKV